MKTRQLFISLTLGLGLALLWLLSMHGAWAATYVVTSTADSGPGTLRQALLDAGNGDTITFDQAVFPPGSPVTITLTSSQLPDLDGGNVTIDASSAGVILDGSAFSGGEDGFGITSSGNVIKGVQIVNFPGDGIEICCEAAQDNIIGGSTPANRNVVSGNGQNGIRINGTDVMSNTISGNYIGVDATGLAALPNGEHGISIYDGASYNLIGGSNASPGGACTGECNLISGNSNHGVSIWDGGTMSNTVSGNYIGTDVNGTAAIGNAAYGVDVSYGPTYNVIGGATEEERNLISGQTNSDGVWIGGVSTMYNVVIGNYIGTDATGTTAIPNADDGVDLADGAALNRIGGTTTAERNVISGNLDEGIFLGGSVITTYVTSNTITGNYIGVDASGTVALGNGHNGIGIYDRCQNNVIGGATDSERNIISDNDGNGVYISGSGTMSNTVSGNYIGTDASGTAALPNADDGIEITNGASYNVIGGDAAGERNLISGHKLHSAQVRVHGTGTDHNILSGNYIGTDTSGFQALGGGYGVRIESGAQYNVIGGTTPSECNLISGNGQGGVVINDSGTMSNTVVGNLVGTDANGTAALGNGGSGGVGFNSGSQHNKVEGNVISGNHGYGVVVEGGAQYNVIGAGNVIAYNADDGVNVDGTDSLTNTITQNSIHDNDEVGIELWNGGNTELAAPTITSANENTISGTACANCTIEVFSDAADEGRVYEGTTTADANGDWSFTKGSPLTGPNITATATDPQGNTSEFSIAPYRVSYRLYLPLVMKGHCSCGPDNYEPNDSFAQAYGPLISGQTYPSYISCCDVTSRKDYFYIDISTTNPIEVDLTNIPAGVDYDLYLYNSAQDEVGRSWEPGNAPEHISHTPAGTGRYYILVFSPYAHYSDSPYSLRVTYD